MLEIPILTGNADEGEGEWNWFIDLHLSSEKLAVNRPNVKGVLGRKNHWKTDMK